VLALASIPLFALFPTTPGFPIQLSAGSLAVATGAFIAAPIVRVNAHRNLVLSIDLHNEYVWRAVLDQAGPQPGAVSR
jgi:hypothetical protein